MENNFQSCLSVNSTSVTKGDDSDTQLKVNSDLSKNEESNLGTVCKTSPDTTTESKIDVKVKSDVYSNVISEDSNTIANWEASYKELILEPQIEVKEDITENKMPILVPEASNSEPIDKTEISEPAKSTEESDKVSEISRSNEVQSSLESTEGLAEDSEERFSDALERLLPAQDEDILDSNENTSDVTEVLELDDGDQITPEEVNEVYNNIMNVCSTAAQAIKRTIAEVLNSRDGQAIMEPKNNSVDLEASLKEKIADFESAVSSCCPIKKIEATAPDKADDSVEDKDKENVSKSEGRAATAVFYTSQPSNNVQSSKQPSKESRESPKPENTENKFQSNLEEESSGSRRQQKSYTNKKKGEKSADQILKSLSSCSNNEEKLQVLCKKHVEVLEDQRSSETRAKQLERQVLSISREKEQLQADHNRMILAKSRLESLCRELQRQNKAVKEESLIRIREEEEKRKEVANKFQATLNDISALMQENSKKNIGLREENAELAKKLKALVDHYEMWEKHMEKVVQQKDLEAQLAKAKHAKTNLLLKQETEKFLREKQSLLENMNDLQKKCTMLATNELQLRTELGDYTAKYEEFQTVLNKSSQVFANFKTDMEVTSKKIKKLEKETNFYKQKWEGSNTALLNMISDKQKQDKEVANAQQRILTLEKLCRALQGERNDLQNQVNVLTTAAQIQACEKEVPLEAATVIE